MQIFYSKLLKGSSVIPELFVNNKIEFYYKFIIQEDKYNLFSIISIPGLTKWNIEWICANLSDKDVKKHFIEIFIKNKKLLNTDIRHLTEEEISFKANTFSSIIYDKYCSEINQRLFKDFYEKNKYTR